jgi:DNA-binding winged helix-turn-helix (wHTH) protein
MRLRLTLRHPRPPLLGARQDRKGQSLAIYRFGPFELDTTAAELKKNRQRVVLRPQPCGVLAYLVANHHQFVSRQELCRAVWPRGIYVHFDQGLNSCIKQIRAALGDSRARPRYVETLTRRGYRFIARVTMAPTVQLSNCAKSDRRAQEARR